MLGAGARRIRQPASVEQQLEAERRRSAQLERALQRLRAEKNAEVEKARAHTQTHRSPHPRVVPHLCLPIRGRCRCRPISLVERAEEEARQTLRRQEAGARLALRVQLALLRRRRRSDGQSWAGLEAEAEM